jgi:hypothetical protein
MNQKIKFKKRKIRKPGMTLGDELTERDISLESEFEVILGLL